jgi:hypothetical protein
MRVDRSRNPTPTEEQTIRQLYAQGLGSPKISQLIGISSHRVLMWMRANGLTRTHQAMVEARRANGLDFHRKTVPVGFEKERAV